MSRRTVFALLGVGLLCVAVVASAVAQTGSGFDLTWNVIGGGGPGDPLTGSGFSVRSTVSQTAVGVASGSGFALGHGYWLPGVQIYLPVVLRNY